MILAIDTSAGQCAIALLGDRVWQRAEPMQRGHAEALFPMIDDLLAEANAAYADLTRIAVCTGPGSFTGIRVGVAAARGLSLGLGIPAIGITRFEALVQEDRDGVVRLPGRQGQVYAQDFKDGTATGAPRIEQGAAQDRFADPLIIARLAARRTPAGRPAPLYLRGADADPPREPLPVMLD